MISQLNNNDRIIDAYLRQIKFKAECLAAYAPGGLCEDGLVRSWEAVEQLKEINQLLIQALAGLPTKGGV